LVYGLGRSSPASLEVIFADEMDSLSEELHAYPNTQTGELITISSEEPQAAAAAAAAVLMLVKCTRVGAIRQFALRSVPHQIDNCYIESYQTCN